MHSFNRPVILFDGVCNLCNASVKFVLKRDRRKKFIFGSLQGKYGEEFLKKNPLPSGNLQSFILQEGDQIYTQSTAALRVLKILGGGWKLFYGLMIIPKYFRDGVYHFIAQNRYRWFGKKDECWIPKPEWKDRFLS